jgi:hypothetical protein
MPEVARVILVDRGTYKSTNLSTQAVIRRELGRPKATVQAARLRRINPGLDVVTVCSPVENVPLGRLRADVILAGLDNRRARQILNEAAWHLGVPWIDAGVDGRQLRVRLNVYVPGNDAPCLECAWGERDYETLEQIYPCGKLLRGDRERAATSRQVLLDVAHHKHYLITYRRNPDCRFADHMPWLIEPLAQNAGESTLADLRHLMTSPRVPDQAPSQWSRLRVHGQRFTRRAVCSGCGHARALLQTRLAFDRRQRRCRRCGGTLVTTGLDTVDWLDLATLSQREARVPLRRLGIRTGDVISLSTPSSVARHFEITERNFDSKKTDLGRRVRRRG